MKKKHICDETYTHIREYIFKWKYNCVRCENMKAFCYFNLDQVCKPFIRLLYLYSSYILPLLHAHFYVHQIWMELNVCVTLCIILIWTSWVGNKNEFTVDKHIALLKDKYVYRARMHCRIVVWVVPDGLMRMVSILVQREK